MNDAARMTDTELIAQQARRIADLEQQAESFASARHSLLGILYCIGGPLNDNKLGYTKEQLTTFWRIRELFDE